VRVVEIRKENQNQFKNEMFFRATGLLERSVDTVLKVKAGHPPRTRGRLGKVVRAPKAKVCA
jgi:hypothetical protein